MTLTSMTESASSLVDGAQAFGSIPALERLGEARGSVLRRPGRQRVDGTVWEVEAMPL